MSAPRTTPGFESPSLGQNGSQAAYELKFLIDDRTAADTEAWAKKLLTPDPHGQPDLGGAYRTTSLYFDTPALDVYHRTPGFRRRKFRARRYGMTTWVYLERKWKSQDQVRKRRSSVPEGELARLEGPASDAATPETWEGDWFHRRIAGRGLRPACRLSYLRTAYASLGPEGPMRLTLDRDIRGVLTDQCRLEPFEGGAELLAGRVILELKFINAMPMAFKTLVQEFRLSPGTVSKYRVCREAWGVAHATPTIRGEVSSA